MSPPAAATGPRLVVIIDSLALGGAQRLLQLQVELMAADHPVLVINLSGDATLAPALEAQGVEVHSGCLSRLSDLRGLLRLGRMVAQWKPDLIHSHLLYATLVGAVIARRLQVPHVVTLHDEQPEDPQGPARLKYRLKSLLEARALSGGTDVAIACGPRVGHVHKPRLSATPLVTVENRVRPVLPLRPDERATQRAAAGLPEGHRVVVAAGRLVPQKGFDILLAAYARAAQAHPDSLLMIAGEGPGLPDLQQQARALNLGDRLRLLGPVPDLMTLLPLADVFVLASRHEGLPLVLLEALAAARPVVATRVGDVETVLGADGGLLVEPGHAAPLAAALDRVLGDSGLRAQLAAAAERVGTRVTDVTGFAGELEAVYRHAARRRGRQW